MLLIGLFILLLRLHVGAAELTCPYDYTFFDGKCYTFVDEPLDIAGAMMICEKIGAELVSIHSEEEAAFIVDSHGGSESWIGLFCNGWDENWEWTDQTPVDYVNFEDRTSNTENCKEVPETQRFGLRDDLLWWKREWNELHNFTCMRDPINCPDGFAFLTNSYCYASNATVKMDYGNATQYCANLDAYLPSVESPEVSNALTVTMKRDGGEFAWIGLECNQANTSWYWSDHVCYGASQANFADVISSVTCYPFDPNKYALDAKGKWKGILNTNQLSYVICTAAALPMPTEAPDIAHCPAGYTKYRGKSPDDDWCFAMNHPLPLGNNARADFATATDFCKRRGEMLPIVESSAMTIFLRSIRASFDVVRKSPFWIALECGDDGAWRWSDGTPLDPNYTQWYGNTADPCDPDYRVVFNGDGKWEQIPSGSGQHLIICAVRASTTTEEPFMPTQPESEDCPSGMHELTEKWCGVYSEPGSWTWSAAANYCAVNGYGSLPSVENDEASISLRTTRYLKSYLLAAALQLQRQNYVGTDQEAFWIGLECVPDDQEYGGTGVWSWLDGTPWNADYAMFLYDPNNCTVDGTRFVFNSIERWIGTNGEDNALTFVVCTAPKLGYYTTVTTEAPVPIFRCDLDWLELFTGLCYTISDVVADYDTAQLSCELRDAVLPSIQSPKTNDAFMDVLKHLGYESIGFWIGLDCDEDGGFCWDDGAVFDYKRFKDIHEQCSTDNSTAYYFEIHGDWIETPIDDERYIVCERPAYEEVSPPQPVLCTKPFVEINGECYSFSTKIVELNYQKAFDSCDSMQQSRLPSIPDQTTNAKILFEANGQIFWLGVHCENGLLEWDDGTPMLYDNFDAALITNRKCDKLSGNLAFVFSGDGKWRPVEKSGTEGLLVCMKEGTPYTPTSPATTTVTTTSTTTKATTKKPVDPASSEETDDPDHPGTTTHKPKTTTTAAPPPDKIQWWMFVVIGAAVILGILVIVLVVLFVRYYCKRKASVPFAKKIYEEAYEAARKKASRYAMFPKKEDDWEIDRRFVLIDYDKRLGQGAFGSVHEGRVLHKNLPPGASRSIIEMSALKKGNDLVAVKMLHESADKAAEMEFRDEIDLMKTIGYHERLVNMLACVTDSEPVLLIIEYCPHGDLLQFMRERRMYMLEHEDDPCVDGTLIITQRKQLMFAMQIAYGLEYLSSRGFVHRDIAARNILVDHNESCKIGDFGLCRVMGEESEHYHSRGGRLPLKWMSPEAMAKYEFTVASDVWSFGVLLFEIITLGGTPYPDWPASELLQRLKRGERMERPDNCTDAMHALLHECWRADPADRPIFSTLRKKLAMQLEQVSPDEYYLKLNAQANYYAASSQEEQRVATWGSIL